MSIGDEEQNAGTGAATVTTTNKDKVDVKEYMDKYQLTDDNNNNFISTLESFGGVDNYNYIQQ